MSLVCCWAKLPESIRKTSLYGSRSSTKWSQLSHWLTKSLLPRMAASNLESRRRSHWPRCEFCWRRCSRWAKTALNPHRHWPLRHWQWRGASQPISKSYPEPVPPAIEPTNDDAEFLQFHFLRPVWPIAFRGEAGLKRFELGAQLVADFAVFVVKIQVNRTDLPRPLLGSLSPRLAMTRGVKGSHSLIWGVDARESSSRLYFSMLKDSMILSSSENFT